MTSPDNARALPFVGIDFGTTNTAVALADGDGSVRLARLPGVDGGTTATWRTVLYFEPDGPVHVGAPAIRRYVAAEGEGRLVQSIKSHLASASFTRTIIGGRTWTLEGLGGGFLRGLRAGVDAERGDNRLGTRAVVGRPVRYWGAGSEEDDARAVGRLRAALALAGFSEVIFEFEPIAAALRYAARLDHDELLLVADFGGGTSDFSLVRVGPRVGPGDAKAILATGGLAIGGDSFDARIIDARVAPALGHGTAYKDGFGAVTPVPSWLFSRLRRWHHLSFLKDADTLRLLDRLEQGSLAPERIARLVHVVKDDLGLPLHQAVEAGKLALSAAAQARLSYDELDLDLALARGDFEGWIAEDLQAVDAVVESVLARAGVGPGDVDSVFATGGSSLVPAVRGRLAERFGEAKLAGGEELTSVAWGLAARARQVFAG
jgi:hypothetical chaperone protein